MLFKHSKRTIRTSCHKCGRKDGLYWAHDVNQPKGNTCDECQKLHGKTVDGKMILMEYVNGSPIVHKCHTGIYSGDPMNPEMTTLDDQGGTEKVWTTETSKPEPTTVKEPMTETKTVHPDDAALQLAELFANLAKPQIDTDTIRGMVKEEFQNIVQPTRVVTVNAVTGERKELSGAQHYKLADVLMDLEAGEHVMMVGPAGTGKSTIAEQCAEALDRGFNYISLGPTTTLSMIIGYNDGNGVYHTTPFRDAFENGKVFLFDEVDNGHPGILTVLNAALANGKMAFPDGLVEKHENFAVVATANTYGTGPDRKYVGRNQLDAAFLDRFTMEEIPIDEDLEQLVCESTGLDQKDVIKVLTFVRKVRSNVDRHKMMVIVSPRASAGMCRLLKAGRKWDDAVNARVRKGMSDQDWIKVQ